MSTPDIERRLTAVLHDRAEDAMSSTDTARELEAFEHRLAHGAEAGTRRWVLATAAALTAAALALGAVWSSNLGGDPNSGPAHHDRPAQTAEERVAQEFAAAFFAGDTARVNDSLASRTLLKAPVAVGLDWRDYLRYLEAVTEDHDVKTCQATTSSDYGTNVVCPFDYHSMRSEELGLGPFGNNSLAVVVTDGKIRSFTLSYNYADNGNADLYEDISTWMSHRHPDELKFFEAELSTMEPSEKDRWIRLWQQRTQEYADEMTGD